METAEHLVQELQGYRDQFAAIGRDAEVLIEGLAERQLIWRENVRTWSIADCLSHLVVTGNQSLHGIHRAVSHARARGVLAGRPGRYSVLGTWFIRLMDAPPTIRFKAPKAYRPVRDWSPAEVLARFSVLQQELVRALDEANGIDLRRAKVGNPVSRWFTLSVGQEFAFTAAHERRHLWQASIVRRRLVSNGVSV